MRAAPGLGSEAALGLGDRAAQVVMALSTRPPLAICHSRKIPPAANSKLADHTARNAGIQF